MNRPVARATGLPRPAKPARHACVRQFSLGFDRHHRRIGKNKQLQGRIPGTDTKQRQQIGQSFFRRLFALFDKTPAFFQRDSHHRMDHLRRRRAQIDPVDGAVNGKNIFERDARRVLLS